jgi:hypothetical protein
MATFIRNRSRLVVLLSAGLAGSLVLAATAYALTASSFKYSSAKTGYLRVSHMDFIPNVNFAQWSQSHTSGLTTAGNSCFNAGVDLPVGAKVKTVTWFYQSGATKEFEGSFRMNQLGTGVGSPIVGPVFPDEDSGLPTSVTLEVPPTLQRVRAGRAYWVEACPGNNGDGSAFFGARIKYTYTSAGS